MIIICLTDLEYGGIVLLSVKIIYELKLLFSIKIKKEIKKKTKKLKKKKIEAFVVFFLS